jgi:hypothetical protein
LLSYATTISSSSCSEQEPRRWQPPLPLLRERLVVRIGASNAPSVALFESLGFRITKRVEVFDEVEMRLSDPATNGFDWRSGTVEVVVFP